MTQTEIDTAAAGEGCFLDRLGIDTSGPDATRRLLELIGRLEQARPPAEAAEPGHQRSERVGLGL